MNPEHDSQRSRPSEADIAATETGFAAHPEQAPRATSIDGEPPNPSVYEVSAPVDSDRSSSEQSVSESPDHASTDWYAVDARYVGFSRMVGLIFSAILAVFGLFGLAVLWWFFFGTVWWTIGLAGYVIAIAGLLLMAILWPKIEFRHIAWRLDERGLEIRRGVFWKHHLVIPTARLQHADISQGPVQRLYGLAKLTVYTAGTFNASVELEGLTYPTAAWIRDQLIKRREELDVV